MGHNPLHEDNRLNSLILDLLLIPVGRSLHFLFLHALQIAEGVVFGLQIEVNIPQFVISRHVEVLILDGVVPVDELGEVFLAELVEEIKAQYLPSLSESIVLLYDMLIIGKEGLEEII